MMRVGMGEYKDSETKKSFKVYEAHNSRHNLHVDITADDIRKANEIRQSFAGNIQL